MQMHHFLIIHSSIEGHIGCFHFLAFVSRAAVNMGEEVSV